jgi:hypothetical protein
MQISRSGDKQIIEVNEFDSGVGLFNHRIAPGRMVNGFN